MSLDVCHFSDDTNLLKLYNTYNKIWEDLKWSQNSCITRFYLKRQHYEAKLDCPTVFSNWKDLTKKCFNQLNLNYITLDLWQYNCKYLYHAVLLPGPILESKGMCVDFHKNDKKSTKQMLKKDRIFENLGKKVQNLKIFWKRESDWT